MSEGKLTEARLQKAEEKEFLEFLNVFLARYVFLACATSEESYTCDESAAPFFPARKQERQNTGRP